MGFLQGKRALITGVASQRSIASGIADAMHREGAELAFTYQNDKLKSRVEDAAKEYGAKIVLPCDVGEDAQIDAVFSELGKHWDGFDILVHSVGFAPASCLARTSSRSSSSGACSSSSRCPSRLARASKEK